MKSHEISRSKIGPFSLACSDPYIGIGWEYQSNRDRPRHLSRQSIRRPERESNWSCGTTGAGYYHKHPTNERQKSYTEITNQSHQQRVSSSYPMTHTETTFRGNLLLIGDSILNGVNTKGLVKGIQKHSKGGATVNDLIKEISVYDVRNFETCTIYITGNTVQTGRV